MERQPISREGYDKLREEIRVLDEIEMPAIAERIKTAREEGDLKENAEYHEARQAQGLMQAKINQLKSKLASCYIAERSEGPKSAVEFGAKVKIRDLSDDAEEMYELVGPGEEDYEGDVMKILTTSPIGTAMLGKKVGDRIEVAIPRGKLRMEILAIE
ncbi:MAG: transcription elongation factor GreA [Planctomycetaceae bacterium]|nr:transcription elongation factor GreA [Planctomycetaceae bacterium]